MSTIEKKESTFKAAAHYAIYLGLFWVFKYLFIMGAESNPLYAYISNILSIGTPILFYALACVYRDKKLGGKIVFGKVVAFGIFLFFFASFLEAVVVAIHIIIIDPQFLPHLQDQIFAVYQNMKFPDKFLDRLDESLSFGPSTFIAMQIFSNTLTGLFLALVLGYFITMKKPTQTKNN